MAEPLHKVVGGKYEILQKMREGGMGSIYRVRHRLLDEVRVIKVLHPQLSLDESLQERFKNEARAAIQLRHPNIAHLYDFSIDDRSFSYIVMEYIDGVTLQELLDKTGSPSLGLAVQIGCQCLQAIGYLHKQGFVHRDIASDNLMLTTDFEDNPLVKLIDLGIAKVQGAASLTATGLFMGKVRYSPPEQFVAGGGAANLDHRSDIYSFGVLLYELLTGDVPIEGDDFSEIVAGHLFREPVPLSRHDPEGRIPESLRAAVMRALAKKPEERFQEADEFLAALAEFTEAPASARDEFTKALRATSSALEKEPQKHKPGSTQSRLNRQFDIDRASIVRDEALDVLAQARSEPLEPSAMEATPARGEAVAAAVQKTRVEKPNSAARQPPPQPPPPKAEPAAAGRNLWLAAAGRNRWLAAAIATGALVVLVAVGLWLWLPDSGQSAAPDLNREVVYVERHPAWDAATSLAGSGLDLEELGEPPPSAEPSRPSRPPVVRAEKPQPPPVTEPATDEVAEETEPADEQPATVEPVPSDPEPAPEFGGLYTLAPGVVPPALVEMPRVQPPPGARHRTEVVVVLSVLVNHKGEASAVEVEAGPILRRRYRTAAMEIARRAKFEPATRNGIPGRMWTRLRVVFPAP